jgi:hypothetical protein
VRHLRRRFDAAVLSRRVGLRRGRAFGRRSRRGLLLLLVGRELRGELRVEVSSQGLDGRKLFEQEAEGHLDAELLPHGLTRLQEEERIGPHVYERGLLVYLPGPPAEEPPEQLLQLRVDEARARRAFSFRHLR